MATERNNYELPNNEEFENLLQENLQTLKPLEMKEKEVAGQKQLFPFWNVVELEEVHYSAESYLTAKQKKERSVKDGNTLINHIEDVMGNVKNTEMVNMTNAVKAPKNNIKDTSTKKQVTEWDSTSGAEKTVNSNAANPKKDNVGAVKPKKNELKDTSTKKQVTEWDATDETSKTITSKFGEPYGGIDFSKFM